MTRIYPRPTQDQYSVMSENRKDIEHERALDFLGEMIEHVIEGDWQGVQRVRILRNLRSIPKEEAEETGGCFE